MTDLQHSIETVRVHLENGNFEALIGGRLYPESTRMILNDLRLVLEAAEEADALRGALLWVTRERQQVMRFQGEYHCGGSSAATAVGALLAEYRRSRA